MKRGRYTLPTDETRLQHERELKIQICEAFARLAFRYGLSQRELAGHLGTSPSTVSRIFCKRTDRLSFNFLLRAVVRLAPQFKILISI